MLGLERSAAPRWTESANSGHFRSISATVQDPSDHSISTSRRTTELILQSKTKSIYVNLLASERYDKWRTCRTNNISL